MHRMKVFILGFCLIFSWSICAQKLPSEFIFTKAPFASSHASTIVETPKGLVSAFFAGSDEGNKDVGIWLSRNIQGRWTPPVQVADGVQNKKVQYPCWNPVLFQMPQGELILFYKVGPKPSQWWGMLKRSKDAGLTWSAAEKLPSGILGPVKNKPLLLAGGTLLCPSSSEDSGDKLHFEMTKDGGRTWRKTKALNDGKTFSAIQPSVIFLQDGRMKLLCRSNTGFIMEAYSSDQGNTWTSLQKTNLKNPNSGSDAITLKSGLHVLVHNPLGNRPKETEGEREILAVSTSKDGQRWTKVGELENTPLKEFSYPAIIQTRDGRIHITYTWKREKIKHAVLKF
jgi:predicted neuraminidase